MLRKHSAGLHFGNLGHWKVILRVWGKSSLSLWDGMLQSPLQPEENYLVESLSHNTGIFSLVTSAGVGKYPAHAEVKSLHNLEWDNIQRRKQLQALDLSRAVWQSRSSSKVVWFVFFIHFLYQWWPTQRDGNWNCDNVFLCIPLYLYN